MELFGRTVVQNYLRGRWYRIIKRTVVWNYLGGGMIQEDYSIKLDVIIQKDGSIELFRRQNYLEVLQYKFRRNYNGSIELFIQEDYSIKLDAFVQEDGGIELFIQEDGGIELFGRTVVWNCLGGRQCRIIYLGGLLNKVRRVYLGGRQYRIIQLRGLQYKVRRVRLEGRWYRIIYLGGRQYRITY